jgi:hypothetical protein
LEIRREARKPGLLPKGKSFEAEREYKPVPSPLLLPFGTEDNPPLGGGLFILSFQ